MNSLNSRMLAEASEGPAAAARLLAAEHGAFAALGADLRHRPPLSLLTVARGGSDHAAHYMAYLAIASPAPPAGHGALSLPSPWSGTRCLNKRR